MVETIAVETLVMFCRFAGVTGFVFYIASFAGVQLQIICGNGSTYLWLNLIAACLVLIGLTYEFNLASAMIQVTWILIALVGLYMRLLRRQTGNSLSAAITHD